MTDTGCPSCGRDIDRLGGNPDCPTCAAEPPSDEAIEALAQAVLAGTSWALTFRPMTGRDHVMLPGVEHLPQGQEPLIADVTIGNVRGIATIDRYGLTLSIPEEPPTDGSADGIQSLRGTHWWRLDPLNALWWLATHQLARLSAKELAEVADDSGTV